MAIILASKSPRRQELMRLLGLEFTIHTADVDETMDKTLPPEREVARVGGLKAAKIAETAAPEDIVVAADTIVVVDGAVLGKPHDEEEAFHMLKTLSGRGHEVMTGLNVWHEGKLRQEVVLAAAVHSFKRFFMEPMDKAGSYGIQGYGAIFVDHLEGDYFSVMGLPLCALARMLAECGVSILREKEAPEG
mgnify:CR=1 FL=1